MGDKCEANRAEFDREVDSIAGRLATFFATLHEYPAIRYKMGRAAEPSDPPGAGARSKLTNLLALKLSERVMVMQRSGQLPNRETCDLVIVDRSVDPVAPMIHEWTYEAMVYDLLPMDENAIRWGPVDLLLVAYVWTILT